MSDDVSLAEDTVKQVLREYGYVNAKVTIPHDLTIDELVDAVMDNREYLPSMVTVNKADLIDKSYLPTVKEGARERDLDPDDVLFISAEKELGLDGLRERLSGRSWGSSASTWTSPVGGVDYEEPLVLFEGDTVGDACTKIGGEFDERFKFARVSGTSAKHDDQQVGKGHELADEDVLRIVARK